MIQAVQAKLYELTDCTNEVHNVPDFARVCMALTFCWHIFRIGL